MNARERALADSLFLASRFSRALTSHALTSRALTNDGEPHFAALAREFFTDLSDPSTFDITDAADRARHLARTITHAFGHDFDRDLVHVQGLDYARTRDHHRDLFRIVANGPRRNSDRDPEVLCYAAVRLYVQLMSLAPGSNAPRERTRVSAIASRVTAAAAALLPVPSQARYREEFASELLEMAAVSRRAQWSYAFGVLAAVWPLRRRLKRSRQVAAWER